MAANTPELPHNEGDTFTNEETGIKYEFINGAWRAVSSKAAEDVADALGQIDLERVLTNGNVADKDIYLTHIASSDADIIDVSPEKAKVIIATERDKVPTFELQHYSVDSNSQVKLELDEDGTRFDIECDEKVNNIHFRFEDDVKLELNKDGDAVFSGDVDVKGHFDVSQGISTAGNAYMKFSPKVGNTQLLTIDSGSSYLPMLHLKSYTGATAADDSDDSDDLTRARKDVLIVRANGNADLLGKLKLSPGETDNEAVTYGQLATVAEEIEQIIPAYERGKYNFSLTDVSTSTDDRGKYTLLRLNTASDNSAATRECENQRDTCNRIPDKDPIDCEIEYTSCIARLPAPGTVDIVTNSFNSVEKIKFSKYDADGAKHQWTDVAVGQIIDIFNDGDDSYFVGEITAIDNSNANLVLLTVNKVQAKGNAVGAARIKVFTLNNEIDELTNYVRKTGDQMTGTLETTGRILIRPDDTGAKGANNMLVVNQLSANGNGSIVRIQQDGNDIIKVQDDKTTTFNNYRITDVGAPTDGEDATNRQWVESLVDATDSEVRKYIDDKIAELSVDTYAPAHYSWKRENRTSGNPSSGYWYINSGEEFMYLSSTPQEGVRLNSTGLLDDTGSNGWNGTRVQCSMWKKSGSSYVIAQTFEAQKYRTSYRGGTTSSVIFQLEIHYPKIKWSDIDKNVRYWISIPGLVC